MNKRCICTFAVMLSYVLTFAQIVPTIKLGTEVEPSSPHNFCFGGQLVAGFQVNEMTTVGMGTGISYTDLLFEPAHYNTLINYYSKDYKETGAYVPLFATIKVKFIEQGVSPYISADLGKALLIPFSEYARKYVSLGLFINPHFGVEFPLSSGSIGLEAGYKYQIMKNTTLNPEKLDYSQTTFSVVYNF